MPPQQHSRPEASEYNEYYGRYISLVRGNDILDALTRQLTESVGYLRTIAESKGEYRYAEGKWSVKEVIEHVTDSERVFSYRALSFGRADAAALPGFEQDDWMKEVHLEKASLKELIDEFEHVRKATISLFTHFPDEAWSRKGVASENPMTVRALAFVIAGHASHHMGILRAKYTA